MKNLLWPMLALMALMAFAAASCSNDDDTPSDPQGTVVLNMLDESNGKTMLEDSGIYIDKGQNFVAGNNCEIFVVGKSGGLGSVSVKEMKTSASKAAVQSGYGYVAVRPGALIVFPSGAKAMRIDDSGVNYMKFYVVSPLKESDKTIGAAVKYVLATPNNYRLPEFQSTALTIDWRDNHVLGDEVALTLSDSDFEYDFHGTDGITCEKRGRKLFFRLNDFITGEYALYLRIRESYTMVYVIVE